VPYVYKEKKLVNAIQWAVGLELMLLITDPWRVFLTTDHPNGACFWRYPELIRLLTDADFRKQEVSKLPAEAQKRIVLADLDRQYTLSDVAIITSAGPARALGLARKGQLGVGADADVTLYESNPEGGVLFEYPRYVIKGGEVVVEDGQIRAVTEGRQFLVQPSFDEHITEFLRPVFQKVYTMSFDNYPVELERIRKPDIQTCTPSDAA
jgi:formylmethanofuran dehydrogenase subunit A